MAMHHPDTRLLNEYAAGTLPLAQSVCISLHLNYCDQCKRTVHKLQKMAAAMFEDLSPKQVDDSLLNTVFARIDEEPEPLRYAPPAQTEDGYPSLVQRLMHRDYHDLEWQRISSNLRISRLRTGDQDNEFALYHIKAGGTVPTHTHKGNELTLVLEGGFSDDEGHYTQGDFLFRDASHQHNPTADQDGDCICIGVLDAPIKFTDWKYRAVNPFLKLRAE